MPATKKTSKTKSKSRSTSKPKTRSRSRSTRTRDAYDDLFSDCRPGYERGLLTGECTKIPCYDLYGNYIHHARRNKYGECEFPDCPSGKIRNPDTGKCIGKKTETGRFLRSLERADRDILKAQYANEFLGLQHPVFGPQNKPLFGQEAHEAAQKRAQELKASREASIAEYTKREQEMREYRRKLAEVEDRHRLRLENFRTGGSMFTAPTPAPTKLPPRVVEASRKAAERSRQRIAERQREEAAKGVKASAPAPAPSGIRTAFSFLNPYGFF